MEAFRLIVSIALLGIVCAVPARWIWRRSQAKKADSWPTADATVESGAIEVVFRDKGSKVELPVFSFSYKAAGGYYGGRFALLPYITDPGMSVIDRMIGRKLLVRYDPQRAERWFIPDELIEGCRIEQNLSPHLVNLKPLE